MSVSTVIPPPSPQTIIRTRMAGIVILGISAIPGLIELGTGEWSPSFLITIRIWLTLIGGIVAGTALSLNPTSAVSWLFAAGSMGLARLGFPNHWDSFQFLATVLAAISLAGAVLAAIPIGIRCAIVVTYIIFHFGGILTATTWPTPTPWITDQLGNRVYHPYLKFLYLGNAYHFYSPEPGPASHLYFLLKFRTKAIDPKTGKPTEKLEWVTLPTRPEQVKDPLALTYYRRLAISEQCAAGTPDAFTPATFEKSEQYSRRIEVDQGLRPGYPKIPIAPPEIEPWGVQCKVPSSRITAHILPSYVRHLAVHHSSDDREVVMIRCYRLEHRIMPPAFLASGVDPYHPATYRPYFLGDYDSTGTLIDPQDPMLYWLVPIVKKPGGPSPSDPRKRDYDDYLEKHAGAELEWRRP